eukprot:6389062-Prymnesium_polylepis.5
MTLCLRLLKSHGMPNAASPRYHLASTLNSTPSLFFTSRLARPNRPSVSARIKRVDPNSLNLQQYELVELIICMTSSSSKTNVLAMSHLFTVSLRNPAANGLSRRTIGSAIPRQSLHTQHAGAATVKQSNIRPSNTLSSRGCKLDPKDATKPGCASSSTDVAISISTPSVSRTVERCVEWAWSSSVACSLSLHVETPRQRTTNRTNHTTRCHVRMCLRMRRRRVRRL